MGKPCSKILPGLYLGDTRHANDEKDLKKKGITHILTIHTSWKPIRKVNGITYHKIYAEEITLQHIRQYIPQSNYFIHQCRIMGGSCLVHSTEGIGRAVTLVVAYIMTLHKLPFYVALNSLRGMHSCSCPNYRFLHQLKDFERDDQEREERLLRRTHGDFPAIKAADKPYLDNGLKKFNELLKQGHFRFDDSYMKEYLDYMFKTDHPYRLRSCCQENQSNEANLAVEDDEIGKCCYLIDNKSNIDINEEETGETCCYLIHNRPNTDINEEETGETCCCLIDNRSNTDMNGEETGKTCCCRSDNRSNTDINQEETGETCYCRIDKRSNTGINEEETGETC